MFALATIWPVGQIVPACHFGSILVARQIQAAKLAGRSRWATQPQPADDRLLLRAAAFPVLGALFRTVRTAFEFGRNANRFRGVTQILADAEQELAQLLPPAARMEVLHDAERALQYENRSWMRLMIEAEWFG